MDNTAEIFLDYKDGIFWLSQSLVETNNVVGEYEIIVWLKKLDQNGDIIDENVF